MAAGSTRSSAEVAVCLTSLHSTTEEDSVRASGAKSCQLIESESLAAVLHDAGASGLREAEGSNLDALGGGQEALVVGNPANNNSNLLGQVLAPAVANDLGNRDGCAVHAAHAETVKDDLVELAASTTSKEAVELVLVRASAPRSANNNKQQREREKKKKEKATHLHKQAEVHILALRRCPAVLLEMLVRKVNSLRRRISGHEKRGFGLWYHGSGDLL